MTIDEAIKHAEEVAEENEKLANTYESFKDYGNPKSSITSGHEKCLRCAEEHRQLAEWLKDYKRLLEQEPCGMTAEEYRQRMIQAFHNADTDGLIAVCVLPTEKEFEHLEWLLKNHYKKELCEDCISRQAVLEQINCWIGSGEYRYTNATDYLTRRMQGIPLATPQSKTGRWVDDKCSVCGKGIDDLIESSEWYWNKSPKYCPFCGIKIQPYKAESEVQDAK